MDPAEALILEETAKNSIINETILHGGSAVHRFYENAVVFVSGGSGFLGKQLIEKLLRSCNLKKVCVLLRPKKQFSVEERHKRLVNDPVFECLRTLDPNFERKICIVPGDVNELNLGMSREDIKFITQEVTIIFHVAATTNFTENLKKATLTNVRGTREMLLIAKHCTKLKSFIHISTAFCHATKCNKEKDIFEEFYPSPMKPEALIELAEHLDEITIDKLTSAILGDWANTYSFTKAVAEDLVRNMAGQFPIAVIRPAIVIGAYREPTPGWIDPSNLYGASGLVAGAGLGVLRVVHCDVDVLLDWVPVDLANNAAIASAQVTASRWNEGHTDIKIYTFTGVKRNPCTLRQQTKVLRTDCRKVVTDRAIWYSFMVQVKSRPLFIIMFWLLHLIPAYICDEILVLMGKKPLLRKVYDKAYKLSVALSFYLHNAWKFDDSNLFNMYKGLSPADQIIFNCDMAELNWTRYIVIWCIGIRKYIIKDGLNNTRYAVKKQFWLKILHYTILPLYLYSLYKVFFLFYYLFCGVVSLIK